VGALDRETALRFQVDPRIEGVVILAVEPGSAGSRAGVVAGDVVMEINRREIRDMNDYHQVAQAVGADSGVLVLISRRGQALFIGIEP
jgi:S1-C subfamily serine protease